MQMFRDIVPFLVHGITDGIGGDDNVEYFKEAWEKATYTPRDQALENIQNEMIYHYMQVEIVQMLVNLLLIKYDVRVVELLHELGFTYPFTEETYKEDLKNVVEESQASIMSYEEAKQNKETLVNSFGKGEKADEAYYAKITDIMSKEQRCFIPDEINGERWAGLYKDLFTPKKKPVNERAAD